MGWGEGWETYSQGSGLLLNRGSDCHSGESEEEGGPAHFDCLEAGSLTVVEME